MLLFLNLDCVLAIPADALGPRGNGADGVHRLERLGFEFPSLRIVVTGARRYRMTLGQLRGFFDVAFGPRLVATTPLYLADRQVPHTRLDEIADWLSGSAAADEDWLALDDCPRAFLPARERLIQCETFTASVASELRRELVRRIDRDHAVRIPPSLLTAARPRRAKSARAERRSSFVCRVSQGQGPGREAPDAPPRSDGVRRPTVHIGTARIECAGHVAMLARFHGNSICAFNPWITPARAQRRGALSGRCWSGPPARRLWRVAANRRRSRHPRRSR